LRPPAVPLGSPSRWDAPDSALDNAVAEAFNSTLEWELLGQRRFATREQARRAVAAWIDEYNTVRRHSTNGMLPPVAYEAAHAVDTDTDTDTDTAPERVTTDRSVA
jgi:putative transposase